MSVDWNSQPIMEAARRGALRGVGMAIQMVDHEAVRLILNTAKTGRIYRRRGVSHQASAPGQPFASDTGRLIQSRGTSVLQIGMKIIGRLVFRAKHARHVEYGTVNMAPRSYARPALANKRKDTARVIGAEIAAELR